MSSKLSFDLMSETDGTVGTPYIEVVVLPGAESSKKMKLSALTGAASDNNTQVYWHTTQGIAAANTPFTFGTAGVFQASYSTTAPITGGGPDTCARARVDGNSFTFATQADTPRAFGNFILRVGSQQQGSAYPYNGTVCWLGIARGVLSTTSLDEIRAVSATRFGSPAP